MVFSGQDGVGKCLIVFMTIVNEVTQTVIKGFGASAAILEIWENPHPLKYEWENSEIYL